MTDAFVDHFQILGVRRDATRDIIEKAFRVRVVQNQQAFLHQADPASVQRIQLAKQARDVLRDPAQRTAFERRLDMQKIARRPVGVDSYGYDLPPSPVNDALAGETDIDLRHTLSLLDNPVFRDDLNENALRRPIIARRIAKLLSSRPYLNLEDRVVGKVIAIAARFIMETDCVQLAGKVLSYNAEAPKYWIAALIEHPSLRLKFGSITERREVSRKLAAVSQQFPKLKREFAEALTILAEDNPDLPALQGLVAQPQERSRSGERRTGGRRNRLY